MESTNEVFYDSNENSLSHKETQINDTNEDQFSTADEDDQQQPQIVSTQDTIQLLILRQKIELANELRRLQFSSRSVSTNESRRVLEDFFNQHQQEQPTTSYRSNLVQNEIESLNTQQRVSTILNNSRQLLENSLRTRRNHSTPPQAPIPPPPPIVQHQPISVDRPVQQANVNVQELNNYARQFQFERRVQAMQNSIEHLRREQIIEEISELVHQQLVSQALESQFRTTLERRIGDRLRNMDTDPGRTREFIRNLTQRQTSQIERNDFSHLGIYNNQVNIDDTASTILSNHEIEMQRATATNSREIKALKSEINELKNMMKLSFELQLDIQRSFKQEISGLMSECLGLNKSSLITSRPVNEGTCLICTEASVDTVLYMCGHMCVCYACSMNLKMRNNTCPVCRAQIKDIIRTYKCN